MRNEFDPNEDLAEMSRFISGVGQGREIPKWQRPSRAERTQARDRAWVTGFAWALVVLWGMALGAIVHAVWGVK